MAAALSVGAASGGGRAGITYYLRSRRWRLRGPVARGRGSGADFFLRPVQVSRHCSSESRHAFRAVTLAAKLRGNLFLLCLDISQLFCTSNGDADFKTMGRGTNIFVLDTGLDASHIEFQGMDREVENVADFTTSPRWGNNPVRRAVLGLTSTFYDSSSPSSPHVFTPPHVLLYVFDVSCCLCWTGRPGVVVNLESNSSLTAV